MVNFKNEYDDLRVVVRDDFAIARNFGGTNAVRGTEEEERSLVHSEGFEQWFPALSKEETIVLRDGLNDILKAYHLDRADVEQDVVYRLRNLPAGSVIQFDEYPAVWLKVESGRWITQGQTWADSADFEDAAKLKVLHHHKG